MPRGACTSCLSSIRALLSKHKPHHPSSFIRHPPPATTPISGVSRLTPLLVSLRRSPLVTVPEPQLKQVAAAARVDAELALLPSCLGKECRLPVSR
jgi:hypothetical protein